MYPTFVELCGWIGIGFRADAHPFSLPHMPVPGLVHTLDLPDRPWVGGFRISVNAFAHSLLVPVTAENQRGRR